MLRVGSAMTYETKEILFGALTVAVFVGVLVFMNQGRRLMASAAVGSTILSTKFCEVDRLNEGSEVRFAGIRIGTIERIALDDQYRAVISLKINPAVNLPTDTSIAPNIKLPTNTLVSIGSEGIVGGKYERL